VVAVGAAAAVGAVAGGLVLAVPVGGPLYIAGRAAGVGPLAPAGSLGDPDEIKAGMEKRNEDIRAAIRVAIRERSDNR